MKGRKPKPTQQKILEGNPGKRPLNDQEPQPESGAPPAPEGFNEAARECWDRVIKELVETCGLAKIDFGTLESYCNAYANMWKAQREINDNGLVKDTPFGPKKNPAVTIVENQMKIIRSLASELGMSSSSRSRIKVPPKKKSDPFEEHQKRRAQIHLLNPKANDKSKTAKGK